MKFLIFVFVFYSFSLFAQLTGVSTAAAIDYTKLNVDTNIMKKDLVNDPAFPTASVDQAKADSLIVTNQNKFEDNTLQKIKDLKSCSSKPSIKEIQNCKLDILKKK